MSLSEVSTNSIGRNGKIPDSPTTSMLKAYTGNNSDVDSAPSSIHSMLRNTTETGDIGLFSIKPTRAPYPVLHASPRTSSFLHNVDGLPQHQLKQLSGRLSSLQSHHGTSASSIISMYQSESQKSFRPRMTHYRNNDQRTFSMSQTSLVSYSLSNHRSYGNLRPRSPFAYPTRLKRPGYRPSSPALTDFNGTDARTRFGLDRGSSFRTPSPLSIHAGGVGPAPFSGSRNRGFRAPQVPLRPYTPRPPSSQSFRSQSRAFQRRPSQGSTWSGIQSPSPIPKYYDYSEAFETVKHRHNPSIAVLPSSEQLLIDVCSAETHHKLVTMDTETETVGAPVIATASNVPPKDILPVVESPSPIVAPNRFLRQMSEWEREHTNPATDNNDQPGVQVDDNISLHEKVEAAKTRVNSPLRETIGHHILSPSKPQAGERIVRTSRRATTGSKVPRTTSPLKASVNHNSTSLNHPGIAPVIPKRLHFITPCGEAQSSLQLWSIPAMDLGFIDFDAPEQASPGLQSTISAVADRLNIQTHIPERSISSRTHRDRFSRIFSIDEGFAELARAVVNSGLASDIEAPSASLEEQRLNRSRLSLANNISQSYPSKNAHETPSGADEFTEETDELGSIIDSVRRTSFSSHEISSKSARDGVPRIDSATYPELLGGGTVLLHRRAVSKSKPVITYELHGSGSASNAAVLQTYSRNNAPYETSNKSSMQSAPQPREERSKPRYSNMPPMEPNEEACTMALLEAANIVPWEYDEPKPEEAFPITKYRLWTLSERESRTFNPSSKPSDDGLREHTHKPSNSKPRVPKFKLKVIRASNSSIDTVKVTKRSSSPISSPRNSFESPINLFQPGPSRRGSLPKNIPDQKHTYGNLPLYTRKNSRTDPISTPIPRINLRPPSSSLHFNEVRSFFSDDSSYMEQRSSSLRQRLSHFKAIAIRGTSTDDLRTVERGQAGSALGPRRASAIGSYTTEGVSGMTTIKQRKWKIGQKLKSWWYRGEEKLKGLSKRVKGMSRNKRSTSTEMYAGV